MLASLMVFAALCIVTRVKVVHTYLDCSASARANFTVQIVLIAAVDKVLGALFKYICICYI